MEDDLKMKGSTPLNIAIFVGGCLVFGGTLYGLTRNTPDQKQDDAMEKAVAEAKTSDDAAASGQADFAKMEANEPAGFEATPSGTGPAGDAPAPQSGSTAGTGGATPDQQPRASNEVETTPATATANETPPAPSPPTETAGEPAAAAPTSTASTPPPAEEAPPASSVSTAAPDPAPRSATTQEVAKADDEPNPPVTESPKPSAMGVLTPWWQASHASPFNVQFVGRSEDEKKIVILFNGDVDPASAAGKIRVIDDEGKPVAANWQRGGNARVLVNGDLEPGRYLVLIDPTLSGAQGQPVGVPLHGPVVLQPDSQAS